MSGSVIYTEVVEDDPGAVYLVRRDVRSDGHKEQSLRIDLLKMAIEQLLRVMPEPGEASSAAETVNAVFPTALCEQDPDDDAYCAYHHVWHGQPGDDTV